MTPHLLTARELADVLGLSVETILRWVRQGKLPAIRLPGGAIRFREDEVEGWLQSGRRPVEECQPPRRTPPGGG